jgi:hypothetical protein
MMRVPLAMKMPPVMKGRLEMKVREATPAVRVTKVPQVMKAVVTIKATKSQPRTIPPLRRTPVEATIARVGMTRVEMIPAAVAMTSKLFEPA